MIKSDLEVIIKYQKRMLVHDKGNMSEELVIQTQEELNKNLNKLLIFNLNNTIADLRLKEPDVSALSAITLTYGEDENYEAITIPTNFGFQMGIVELLEAYRDSIL